MNSPYLEIAVAAARAAGAGLRNKLGRAPGVAFKGRRDMVTAADLASQKLIIERINEAFPDHSIMAEEEGFSRPQLDGPVWIIDPLDGTTNFVHGLPMYCVSIALAIDGRLEIGVIYDPERDELFTAQRGGGAKCNDQPIRVSGEDRLINGLTATGFAYDLESSIDPVMTRLRGVLLASQGFRRLGSAALDLAYIAAGRMDVYWEDSIHAWDIAAGCLLVTEAGGRISDLDGSDLDLFCGRILATNGLLHRTMIDVLAE